METIGARIRSLRLSRGMTQEQLGERLGVRKAAIQKYESGAVSNIKPDKVAAMCDVFNVTPSYIMGWGDGGDDLDDIIRKLGLMTCGRCAMVAYLMSEMSDDARDRILCIVEDYSLIERYRR